MKKLVLRLCIGLGMPYAEVSKRIFPVTIPVPSNMAEVKLNVERICGTFDGLLLEHFRDFSVTTFETRLCHLTVEAECNSIRKVIVDCNHAVPVSEKELSDWLEETHKVFPNAIQNLLFSVTLSLLNG